MIHRRTLLTGGLSAGLVSLAGCREYPLDASSSLPGTVEGINYALERRFLSPTSLVREFDPAMITRNFPAINTVNPESDAYHRWRRDGFATWSLPVTGLVARPMRLTLGALQAMPRQSQITQHNCVDGWSAIARWTGVRIAHVLGLAGLRPEARFVVFDCVDGWWDSFDLVDMLHPQSMLTYGMNDRLLPMQHGAPLRLRIERQLGYKSLKFVTGMRIVDRIDGLGRGKGSYAAEAGYQWHAGI